ncbi:hypothetical protein GGI19_000501 [Coemansia pectinata]|uniref:Aminoglycoside phosphotransferase domain-containing protein n=1 Tax=Coemansia pectinata TaxID=1052879 RepID=A0A9W8LD22_9FUNG|nr:hypothetical protein GGI19_000501 [Coemansia pectinata]
MDPTSSAVQRSRVTRSSKAGEVDYNTADYLDAFSSIDRSIRDLIDGHQPVRSACREPRTAKVGHASALLSVKRSASRTSFPSPLSPRKPPATPPAPSRPVGDDDEGGDEAAAVAFLCSGLPHYEGPTPIYYSNLNTALDAYYRATRNHLRLDDFGTAFASEDDGEEEHVPEAAWDIPRPPRPSTATAAFSLLSPQTLAGSPRDAGLSTYEGWIDFEELQAAVNAALLTSDADSSTTYSIGRRTETDYMVFYAIESNASRPIDTTDDSADGGWAVQIPKPSVPQDVFESEVISLAYVGENTKLPVAQVLAYDFSSINPVGVPYAIVSRMPGESLAMHWHSLRSRQKRKVLDQIADFIVQLSELQFPLIGSLVAGDGELVIGSLLDARQSEPGYAQSTRLNSYGPFSSTSAYYRAMITASLDALKVLESADDSSSSEPSLDQIELETYSLLADRFVVSKYDNGPFVLMPENFDLHHFVFDRRTCRLTGVVDWTYSSVRPFVTLIQPPSFTFDDTPRWEPHLLNARMAYRRNLVRYRQWFMSGLQKRAWAALGKEKSKELAQLVCTGYWRYKFESEICENVQYSNPWTFRAIWEHLHPNEEYAVWFATARSKSPTL